jgi:hypothetical protein
LLAGAIPTENLGSPVWPGSWMWNAQHGLARPLDSTLFCQRPSLHAPSIHKIPFLLPGCRVALAELVLECLETAVCYNCCCQISQPHIGGTVDSVASFIDTRMERDPWPFCCWSGQTGSSF